jgi:hypothetical protein
MTTTTPRTAASPVSEERPQDWPEDFPHENGRYMCTCVECGIGFFGHKRRVICKVCAKPVSEEREECARMCEAAGHDERLADGGLYLRAARLLRAPQQQAEPDKEQR